MRDSQLGPNARFQKLFVKSGWSQSKAAQELGLRPEALAQYLDGSLPPKPTVIRLFKLLLGDSQPFEDVPRHDHELSPFQPWEIELLGEIREHDPLQVRNIVRAFATLAAVANAGPAKRR